MRLEEALVVNAVGAGAGVGAGALFHTFFRDRVGAVGVSIFSFFACRWLIFLGDIVFDGKPLLTILAYVAASTAFLVSWMLIRVGVFRWIKSRGLNYVVFTLFASVLVIWGFKGRVMWVAVAAYLTYLLAALLSYRRVNPLLTLLLLGFGLGCMSDARELTVILIPWVGGEPIWLRLLYEHLLLWVSIGSILVVSGLTQVRKDLIILSTPALILANLAQLWAKQCITHNTTPLTICVNWGHVIPTPLTQAFIITTTYLIRITPIPLALSLRPKSST